jgi:hypothetical protein
MKTIMISVRFTCATSNPTLDLSKKFTDMLMKSDSFRNAVLLTPPLAIASKCTTHAIFIDLII